MSWRCLPGVLETNKKFTQEESISVSNRSECASEKSLSSKSDKSKVNPRQIQDALTKTRKFGYSLHFETQIAFLLLNLKPPITPVAKPTE